MKTLDYIWRDIHFDEFKPKYASVFKSNFRDYLIPERYIFNYET